MSITVTIEELYQQHLNGKSIEQLSKETGMGKWALYKAFQRLKYRQQRDTGEIQLTEENGNIAITPKSPDTVKQLLEAIAVIASMVAIYLIYMQSKKRNSSSSK